MSFGSDMPVRCGRLDSHPAHNWLGPWTGNTFRCFGHVITEGAWREYADAQDAAEAEDDRRAEADCA